MDITSKNIVRGESLTPKINKISSDNRFSPHLMRYISSTVAFPLVDYSYKVVAPRKKITVPIDMNLTVSQELLHAIIAHSEYSLKRIAMEIQLPNSTIYRIYKGTVKSPVHRTFQKILELYCRICQ